MGAPCVHAHPTSKRVGPSGRTRCELSGDACSSVLLPNPARHNPLFLPNHLNFPLSHPLQAYVDLLRQVGLAARRSDGAAPGLLRADIPAVIRAVGKQLRSKSAKTKARGLWGAGGCVAGMPCGARCLVRGASGRGQRGGATLRLPAGMPRAPAPASTATLVTPCPSPTGGRVPRAAGAGGGGP